MPSGVESGDGIKHHPCSVVAFLYVVQHAMKDEALAVVVFQIGDGALVT